MKFIKLLSFTFIMSVIFFACGSSGTTIKGNITNADDVTVYLDKIDLTNAIQSLGNEKMAGDKFSFNFPEGLSKGMYRVRIGSKSALFLVEGTEKTLNIKGDLNTLQTSYDVTGSAISEAYSDKLNALRAKTIDAATFDKFILEEADPFLAMGLSLSAYSGNPAKHEIFSKISTKLNAAAPGDQMTMDYAKIAGTLAKSFASQQSKFKVKVGQPAPEIVSTTPDGKEMRLSDLKGKVVLLDFWASWCGPCRRANPSVVKTYHKYKDKGFTVMNVSLDGLDSRTKARFKDEAQINQQLANSKKKWLDAIAKDKLEWPYHVSDLKKWDSDAAAQYGVRSIPSTFLIDKNGNLAALNPSKGNLGAAIEKLL